MTVQPFGEAPLTILIVVFTLVWSDSHIPRIPRSSSPHAAQSDLGAVQSRADEATAAIQALLLDGHVPALGLLTPAEQVELEQLYGGRGYRVLWIDPGGRPGRDTDDALTVLRGATDDGLDPVDYGQHQLDRQIARLRMQSVPSIPDLVSFDLGLSAGLLRYFHHLHSGRVNPRTIGLRLNVPADRHDFTTLLQTAVADHRVLESVADLRPQLAQYRALCTMLSWYRSIAPSVDSVQAVLPPFSRVVHPGEVYVGLDALERLLVAFGDLPARAVAPTGPTAYGGALVDAVKRFQGRHGLTKDGVIGRSTHAALRIPIATRVRQIELALERLRWLPHLGAQRLLAINIPMFRLWGWDTIPANGDPLFGMAVIVGRALRTQTPVFVEHMREVIFKPYWNVPPSIVRKEILPILARDPEYLRRQQMEIVRGPGDDAPVVPGTAENFVLLRQRSLRLRQRPGPHNALGLVKFVFPNAENVYMHGTPAQELFSRSRRDFSHGCVRVENPIGLAEWVLSEQPEWTHDRIVSAMTGARSVHVPLSRPIQVVLFYTTAAVMPDDGMIHFAEDIYRHDALLDRVLARTSARSAVRR